MNIIDILEHFPLDSNGIRYCILLVVLALSVGFIFSRLISKYVIGLLCYTSYLVVTSFLVNHYLLDYIIGGSDIPFLSTNKTSISVPISGFIFYLLYKMKYNLFNSDSNENTLKIALDENVNKSIVTVYITEDGAKLHKNSYCEHIKNSSKTPHALEEVLINNLPCDYFCKTCDYPGKVYLYKTEKGKKFHTTTACNRIKESINFDLFEIDYSHHQVLNQIGAICSDCR